MLILSKEHQAQWQAFTQLKGRMDVMKMRHWADFAGKPVLLADAAGHIRAHGDTRWPPAADRLHDADHYRQVMDALWDIPQCVGYHLCGAYIKNNARKYGFRDPANNQINETVDGIRAVNIEMQRRQNR